MTDVSLIEFIPANKIEEASALHNDGLLENSFLNEFNASDELLYFTRNNWKHQTLYMEKQVWQLFPTS